MLKIDARNKRLIPLGRAPWRLASFFERHRLADFITGGVAGVFQEVGFELMILGADVALGGGSGRRADLLALDPEGRVCLVFASPKQTSREVGLAIEDVSRAARWDWRDAVRSLESSRGDELRAFLDAPLEKVNWEQCVILVGEEFDEEAMTAASFLTNRCRVFHSCLRLRLRIDEAGSEYLSVEDALSGEQSEEARFVEKEEREAMTADIGPEVAPRRVGPSLVALADAEEDSVEEPLAELLEDTVRTALADPAALDELSDERRTRRRFGSCRARRLRLDYFGRPMGARLIDFSEGGLGAETLAPLPVGAVVQISGRLSTEAGLISLECGAHVKHCRPRSNGVCRIGLSFPHSAVREVIEAEAFGRR